jgi:hypothetical protein
MNPVLWLLVAVLLVGVVLFVLMSLTRRGRYGLNQEKYRVAWLKIESSLDKNNPMTFQMAIMSADKLLDQAMRESGLGGETMADRLKVAKSKFSDVNKIWAVHKLRNRIVHEPDVSLNIVTAKRAMAVYKKSLKELGSI